MFGKVLFGFFLASSFVSKKIPTYPYNIHQASPKYKYARNSFINSLCFGSEVCSRDFVGFFLDCLPAVKLLSYMPNSHMKPPRIRQILHMFDEFLGLSTLWLVGIYKG